MTSIVDIRRMIVPETSEYDPTIGIKKRAHGFRRIVGLVKSARRPMPGLVGVLLDANLTNPNTHAELYVCACMYVCTYEYVCLI